MKFTGIADRLRVVLTESRQARNPSSNNLVLTAKMDAAAKNAR